MPNRRTYTDDQLLKALVAGRSWADVMEKLGKPRATSARYVRPVAVRMGFDISRFERPHVPSSIGLSPIKLRENTSAIGTRTEAVVLAALAHVGYLVSIPFGSGHRYDLIVDDGKNLRRIQCKTAKHRKGCVEFPTCSNRRDGSHMDYSGEIDAFAAFCPSLRKVYLVPVGDVAVNTGYLRVDPPAHNQKIGIRWAEPYEIFNFGAVA